MGRFEQRYSEEQVEAAREKIAAGLSLRAAAAEIGCAPSTLSERIKEAEAADANARRRLGADGPPGEGARGDAEAPALAAGAEGGVGPIEALAAVIGHLDIPEHQLVSFTTSALSKARMIANLGLHLQQWTLKFDPQAFPQLEQELRAYQDPDEYCVQDCVISVAMALDQAPKAHQGGRVLPVIYV